VQKIGGVNLGPALQSLPMPDPVPSDADRRRALLTAALGFLQVDPTKISHTGLTALHSRLDSWRGIGNIVVGMERQGYALSLTKISDDGWRATFHYHPMLSADGFATDEKSWRAALQAAREVMKHRHSF
jgi:hypothetical protein